MSVQPDDPGFLSLEDLATRTIPCPHCHAAPGDRCRTFEGFRATRNHTTRSAPLYEAWRDGFAEGRALPQKARNHD